MKDISNLEAGFMVPLIFLAFAGTYFGILYLVERILQKKRQRREAATANQQEEHKGYP